MRPEEPAIRVLGIETSCDETGAAVYATDRGLLAHALHSQVRLHADYGGVVPELASRDHIRRLVPLVRRVMEEAGTGFPDLDAIAYTAAPVSSQEVSMPSTRIAGSSGRMRLGFLETRCYNARFHPSLRSKRMPTVRVKENEPFEAALRRFKRTVEKTGLLTELRAREYYEKPTTERKRKLAAAIKRQHKRLRAQLLPPKLY